MGFSIGLFKLNLFILAAALFHLFGAATSLIPEAPEKCNCLYLSFAIVDVHLGSSTGEGESDNQKEEEKSLHENSEYK